MRQPKPCDRAAQMILELMQDLGLSRSMFAKKFKVSLSLLDKVLSGHRDLTPRLAQVIERGSKGAVTADELMDAVAQPLEVETD